MENWKCDFNDDDLNVANFRGSVWGQDDCLTSLKGIPPKFMKDTQQSTTVKPVKIIILFYMSALDVFFLSTITLIRRPCFQK